ncbi:MAG TPA: HAD-IA family hydrolase [Candidatus Acidoferrales bacterium]|jgi:phosphoglycolate phosphatase|nr:HAD-IA family hydrolase [Candidatus Acidoferrales bacterium]
MVEKNGRFSGVHALIFDLDGTLIDSQLDLVLSVNAMLEHMGREPHVHEKICSFIGNGAPTLVRRALGEDATEVDVEKGLAYFLEYYRAHMLDNTDVYPGVREALALLQKYPMAVLTNKPVHFSRAIIEGLNLSRYFRRVYGGNSFQTKKPDPQGAQILLRELQAAPHEAMMVGDSDVDIKTARNAGMHACGVTYGFGTESLRSYPPDIMLDSLSDLPAHLK